jgi:dTDP-4-dehydrorhamnose 3,5-epimerase-like enzyme
MKDLTGQSGEDVFFGGQARLLRLAESADQRGKLLPIAFSRLPFEPKRCFIVSEVPAGTCRGRHAHRFGSQLLFCLNGRVDVLMRDGKSETTVTLSNDSAALLIGPRIWAQQTYVTENSILMVLASYDYDRSSYIEDLDALS